VKKVHVSSDTGAAAIAHSFTATGRGNHVKHITLKFAVKPTSSEAYTITKNAAAGAGYDTLLYTLDISGESAAADGGFYLVWTGPGDDDKGYDLAPGDSIDIAYTNTDTETYGSEIVYTEGTY
jgi:hypothetical protein